MTRFNSFQNLDPAIKNIRTAEARLTVLKEDGTALTDQEVTIAQKNHQFLFGCSYFGAIPLANNELSGKDKELAERINEKFLTLFNFATLPFYWGRFEPVQGQPDTRRLLNAAKWCVANNLLVKGHPLCWHTVTADWLMKMTNEEILETQIKRIHRDVTDFKGVIDTWDVINEAVIMPVFNKYDNGITRICKQLGRIKTIKTMFEAARTANPQATLLLNDFDVSSAFDILVEGCLEAGVKIDIVGIQSHMHQGYWGVEKTKWVLQNFERFNLPVHFTETTILSGRLMPPHYEDLNDYQVTDWPTTPEGEERQVGEVLTHYKTLFAHPLVSGITWWDFIDGLWLHAPAGLVRADGSGKPAYEELVKLVKGEWWLKPTQFGTDSAGKVDFRGFYGDYELTYQGKTVPFSLLKEGPDSLSIQI